MAPPRKTPAVKSCPQCGKTFGPAPGELRGNWGSRVCCSRECANARVAQLQRGTRDLTKVCPVCGETFGQHPNEYEAAFRKRATCSAACGTRYNGQRRRASTEQPCAQCGATFWRRSRGQGETTRFCSRACYWESKKGRVTYRPPKAPTVERPCQWCGKIMELPPYRVREGRRFCTLKCWREFMRRGCGEGGAIFYRSPLWQALRHYVVLRDLRACGECGVIHKDARRLTVHHIRPRIGSPDPEPGIDHPDNLRTVCFPCHNRLHFGPQQP